MKISMKIIVFFSVFLLGRHVSADPMSDSIYQILSLSVSAIITRMDKMESKMTLLQDRVEKLEAMSHHFEDRSSTEVVVENQDKINSNVIRKMLSDEKVTIRNSIKEMGQQFKEMKGELHTNVSKIKESLEIKASNMTDIVCNNSVTLATEIAILKHELNTTMNKTSQALEEYVEKQENDTKERLSLLETSFQSYTGEQFSSVRTDMSALSLKLSSQSSRESSESSSLSSRMSYTSSLLSSLASRGYLMSSSLSSMSYSMSSSISSMSYSMSSSISSLSTSLYDEERTAIGFSARLDPANSYYSSKEKIKFNDVHYNNGGGYDSSTGIFSAPRKGTYLFVYTLEGTNTGFIHALLVINGKYGCEVLAKGYKNMGTNAAVVYMNSGSQAYVRTASFESKYYIGPYRSQFTGVLID